MDVLYGLLGPSNVARSLHIRCGTIFLGTASVHGRVGAGGTTVTAGHAKLPGQQAMLNLKLQKQQEQQEQELLALSKTALKSKSCSPNGRLI